ncbi:MAG TPA: hypothetical protein VE078_16545 [Thermoanaerobaculia bacterium]|nr:hypothetical protein [Thermoanaerobaculia bacterium]
MADSQTALKILAALRRSPVGDDAILVGSSGLFGFETSVPALTEDVDIAIPEPLASRHGREIIEVLQEQGFEHEPGTATFLGHDGTAFDLLGHGEPAEGDHVGGTGALSVMVFEDLSRILGDPGATIELPTGGRALTPPGFVASKLLTERAHKGTKDKIQALLVMAERQKETGFEEEVLRFLKDVEAVRLDDVRAGAQSAFLALERDPTFSDAGAEGYAPVLQQVEVGLKRLLALLERLHA